jgi:Flp pilus assembly protein TadG
MRLRNNQNRRRGAVLPLAVLTLVAMCGFCALAIDIGLMAVAKSQCQNSADAAAMAGARSLDGTPGQNLANANTNALNLAQTNLVLSQQIPTANITLNFGAFHYDTTTQLFVPQFPPVAPDNYNLLQVTVSYNVNTAFAPVFKLLPGNSGFNPVRTVTATSIAAHRPRDVCIVLDYSGSMNNESDLWNNEAYLDNGQAAPNNPNWTSNNAETVYPLFGHYSNEKDYTNYNNYANLLAPSADSSNALSGNTLIGKSNITQPVLGIPALVNDFYANNRGSPLVSAFTSYPDIYSTAPAGDNYLYKNSNGSASLNTTANPLNYTASTNYATTVSDVVYGNSTTTKSNTWESNGYKAVTTKTFNGYTIGPRYWGMTFFMWPPDPTNDWRKTFFSPSGSGNAGGLNDNTKLWDTSGNWRDPPGNYDINYKAILAWITANQGGSYPIFPAQVRGGRLTIYNTIPVDVPSTAYDHTQPNYNITDPNQRFWKEYIDWTLGVWRDPDGNIQHPQTPSCSMGPDYTFGTPAINSPPGGGQYMSYTDNPKRPRHRMWFGPMTMIQYLSDTGQLPGTAHDISMYPMKNGVGGALTDIQNNHPNDLVAMILFSRPQFNNDSPGTGSFNNAQYNLTNNYPAMINSLWWPPNTGTTDARLWDVNGLQTPHAHGDYDANTASSYGFMLAYNQFSGSSTLQSPPGGGPAVGGLGRRGASRLVIFETDGMANEDSVPQGGFGNGGPYNSYYHIMPTEVVNGAGYSQTNLLQVVEAICNKDDSTPYAAPPSGAPTPPNYPGYATPSKPVIIQCIAFGAIFETPSSIQTNSVNLLTLISQIGQTTFPTSASDPVNGYKWCIGTLSQRQAKLQQAFLKILDSDVPVSLIK